MNTKQFKYIKDKYFEKKVGDPTYYRPKSDKTLNLAPHSLMTIIDLIIKILEQENWDGVTWVKNT